MRTLGRLAISSMLLTISAASWASPGCQIQTLNKDTGKITLTRMPQDIGPEGDATGFTTFLLLNGPLDIASAVMAMDGSFQEVLSHGDTASDASVSSVEGLTKESSVKKGANLTVLGSVRKTFRMICVSK